MSIRDVGAVWGGHDEVEIGLSGRCSDADQKYASGIAGIGDRRDVELDCSEFIEVVVWRGQMLFEEAGPAKDMPFSLGMNACFICSKILLRCRVLVSAYEVDTSTTAIQDSLNV
jgi:hypothetical protein